MDFRCPINWTARALSLSSAQPSSALPPPPAFTCPSGGTCWVGGSSGNWSNASNWSNGVATSSTNVLIDNHNANGQGASAVILDVNGTANNLTVDSDDSLSFNNGTTLTVSGGTISDAGKITINGGECRK
jgi:hypothetical protein